MNKLKRLGLALAAFVCVGMGMTGFFYGMGKMFMWIHDTYGPEYTIVIPGFMFALIMAIMVYAISGEEEVK